MSEVEIETLVTRVKITSSYRLNTSGPLFSVPMATRMTMLPDVQIAEILMPALLKIIHVMLDQTL